MGRAPAGERREDGPELRVAAARGARRRRRRGDPHARAWLRAARSIPTSVDVRRFERLLAEASRAAAADEPADAAREALALWRGPALADVADEPFAAPEIRRLEELRLEALELAIDADLAAGRHHEVAGEIDALVAEHPLRERLHAQRMLALYRCGRQAEALEAYREARRVAGRGDRRRARPGAAPPARRDPAPGRRRSRSRRRRGSCRASSTPRRRRRSPGRDERARVAARALAARARAATARSSPLLGARGHGQDAAGRGARRRGPRRRRDGAVRGGHGSARRGARRHRAGARRPRRPTLLVVDDADRAGADVCAAIAARTRAARLPRSCVATGEEPRRSPGCDRRLARARAARRRRGARDRGALRARRRPGAEPVDALATRAAASRAASTSSRASGRGGRPRGASTPSPDRAAAGRARARALESRAGRQRRRPAVHARARGACSRRRTASGAVVCPFKGLATFDVEDAEYFFGREQLVAELVARLVGRAAARRRRPVGQRQVLGRCGPACCPRSPAGCCPGSDGWTQVLIRPGEHPRASCAGPPTGLGGDRRAVLAVDQFEEAFTACRDERERDGVHRRARRARRRTAAAAPSSCSRCGPTSTGAAPRIPSSRGSSAPTTCSSGRCRGDELRRAITRPAERVGLRVEPDLEDALVADVEGQPGALPLLSTALLELWQQRRGRRAAARRVPPDGRRPRRGRAARRGRVRPPGAVGAGGRPRAPAAARRRGRRTATIVRRRVPLAELERGAQRARRARARRPHRAPAADRERRHRRGRARGAAARVAAAARLARRGRRGPAPASAAGAGGERVGGGRPRSRRPATAAHGSRPRSSGAPVHEPELDRRRARVPRREPGRERARPAPRAAACSPASSRSW